MSVHVRCLAVVLVTAFLSEGCAARARAREYGAQLAQADRLAFAGCYHCLQDAFEIYDRLLAEDFQRAAVVPRAHETAVLLAVREKELGLPATPWIERATALQTEDVPGEEATLLVRAADGLPWNPHAVGPESMSTLGERRRAVRDHASEWYTALAPLATSDRAAAYVVLALACQHTSEIPEAKSFDPADMLNAHAGEPLFLYGVGACAPEYQPHLDRVLEEEPRFIEARYALGLHALGSGRLDARWLAIDPLRAAHEGIPESPALAFQLASVYQATSQFELGLAAYEHVLTLTPERRDALLGKTLMQSHLLRHTEAIATATELIDLGTYHIGEAYYWRAWNTYEQQRLEVARADIEEAKKLWYHSDVLTLAGRIAYDRKALDEAREDLDTALTLDRGNCLAAWFLGLTYAALERWPDGGETFARARTCAEEAEQDLRTTLAQMEAAEMPPEIKARQVAVQRESIDEAGRTQGQAAYNAAWCYLSARDTARAKPHVDRALQDPDMKTDAEKLVAVLEDHGVR